MDKLKDLISKLLKDGNTWAQVQEAIADYLEEEKTGISTKNSDLSAENKRLKKQLKDGISPEVNDLSEKLEQANGHIETLNGKLKDAAKKADKFEKMALTEVEAHNSTLIDNTLTSELVKAKVAPQFLDAAKALLRGNAAVKVDSDGKRNVLVGDKGLAAHVSEWSQSDAGKAFVAAPLNNGGGGTGGKDNGGGGKPNITRTQFDGMADAARSAHFAAGGTVSDA